MDKKEDIIEETEDLEEDSLEESQESEDKENLNLDKDKEELDELKNSFLRLQADFANYKKRAEKERLDTIKYASEKLMVDLLPVFDNFERALQSESEKDGFYEGVQLIHNQLLDALKNNGLSEIESKDQPFDPNLHHAVVMEEVEGLEEDTVVDVLQKGYKLNDRVIRPSMVKVSK